ncbi:hypothetical protein FPOAC2_08315 [Fusarium poae]
MRGSASSRIVGFVSVFLILPLNVLLLPVQLCYTPQSRPSLPFLFAFLLGELGFFLSFSNCPSHHQLAITIRRCRPQWPISDGYAVDTSGRSAYNVLCFRNSGLMEKKISVRHGYQDPDIIQRGNLTARRASSFRGNIPLSHIVLLCNRRKSRKL